MFHHGTFLLRGCDEVMGILFLAGVMIHALMSRRDALLSFDSSGTMISSANLPQLAVSNFHPLNDKILGAWSKEETYIGKWLLKCA